MDGSGEERISNYLDWSDKGNPAIWRYILAVIFGFVFWMWGSIPAVLLLKRYIDDPKYQGTAFEYIFVIGIQAIYFASLHVGNIKEWGNGYLPMLPYLIPALAWGWIAWRTGSLVFPSALHFANNGFLILFINTKGDVIQSAAPFVAETPSIERATVFVIGQNILMIIVSELLLRWRSRK